MPIRRLSAAPSASCAIAIAACFGACSTNVRELQSSAVSAPPAAPESAPPSAFPDPSKAPLSAVPPTDLTKPNTPFRGSCFAEIIDTRTIIPQIQPAWPDLGGGVGEPTLVRTMLPPHVKPAPPPEGEPNALFAGTTFDQPRAQTGMMFPTVGSTGWNPPDPTLAVGPNHVIVTVNSRVEFFTKAGVRTFAAPLDQSGSPGFFEPLGAMGFVFDPKCFFDHYAQRFVIIVLEKYTSPSDQAWVDIAVSDDADPNGVWFRYRTDAVTTIGTSTYWWDFPGAGYDSQAYYVTGNLFGLNTTGNNGWAVRVFDKAPLLTGAPATYSTLREAGFTVMPALTFGATPGGAAIMATLPNSTTVRLWALTNPLTAPALVSTNVTVPTYTGAITAPTINGSAVSSAGMTMPYWRNGRLFLSHNASVSGRNAARWHEIDTATWPTSGTPTRIQSGNIDAGANFHTLFPSIAVNSLGEAALAVGLTSESTRVAAAVAGRLPTDPLGTFGVPQVVKPGDADGGGRWGDYYACAVDPVDDTTFWAIGEYKPTGGGWQNWVGSFTVTNQSPCRPVPDNAGVLQIGVTPPITIDVLANDTHVAGSTMTITSFAATSTLGGSVTRSVGSGPGGRDQLIYSAPPTLSGHDSFAYTVSDTSGNSAASSVVAFVFNPLNYRNPEAPSVTRSGVLASWYDLPPSPTELPNFSTLTSFGSSLLPQINIPSTTGTISTSGRTDNLGAVFEGFVNIPTSDVYRFHLTSDDGSKLFIGSGTGTLIIDHNGTHGMTEASSSLMGLKPGKHRLRIEYFESGGGAGITLAYSSTSTAKTIIPTTLWSFWCVSDFNRSGTVSVQDIFDFLAAWFNADARADINATGGISVQDIFDFLSLWFAGC